MSIILSNDGCFIVNIVNLSWCINKDISQMYFLANLQSNKVLHLCYFNKNMKKFTHQTSTTLICFMIWKKISMYMDLEGKPSIIKYKQMCVNIPVMMVYIQSILYHSLKIYINKDKISFCYVLTCNSFTKGALC